MPTPHYVLDEIVHRESLIEVERLAAVNERTCIEHLGRKAMRIEAANKSVSLKLPLPCPDLDHLDVLIFDVCVAANHEAAISLRLELVSQTAGLPYHDSLDSGHAETFTSASWRELLFPYENLHIYGIPAGAKGVGTATLHLRSSGTVWLSGLYGVRRKRAVGPRLEDAGLLEALDLERAELSSVKAAQKEGQVTEALAALLRHIKTRKVPRHIFALTSEGAAGADLTDAEQICAHTILGYDVGTPINWRLNPNGYLEWMHAFNRMSYLPSVLRTYVTTKDPKYVRCLEESICSWIAANPEPVGHNGGGDPGWETLSAAVRIYSAWLQIFFTLLDDPHFSDSARLAMLKSFHGHAEHLMQYKGYANNWLIVESRVLALLGILFPEFKRAPAWMDEGMRRLEQELTRQILPDGANWEIAPNYHMMAARGFLDVYEVAKLNGRAMPSAFEEHLPKVFEYIAGITRPDGSLPALNDASYKKGHYTGADFLKLGARIYDRPDLLASPEGPFAGRTRVFHDVGLVVQASGTQRNARWLLFDAGPFGASHQHEDALAIELFAMGVRFLVDPGISSYLNDAWTKYYRHTSAHSTVLVNGAGQNRRAVSGNLARESVRGKFRSVSGPLFDFASAAYADGYHGQPDGITHRREIVFVRGAYYLLFDEISGAAAQRIDALFHFAPMRVETDATSRRVLTRMLKGANLEIIPIEPRQGLKLSLLCGETDPVQGWVSMEAPDQPAPVACYTVRGEAPLRFAAALVPFAAGVSAGVTVSRLPKVPPGVLGVRLTFADGSQDRIFMRRDATARIPHSGKSIDADVLVERRDAQGRRTACSWMLGESMTVEA